MPRDHVDVMELRFAVPTGAPDADLPRVASIIGGYDVAGLIIDGARVGAAGWVFARVLGDAQDSTLLRYRAHDDATAFDLPWATVHQALVDAFGDGVVAGAELDLGEGRKVLEDGLFALGGEHAAMAVLADKPDHMFSAVATGVGRGLVAARTGGWVVVTPDGPATDEQLVTDLDDSMLALAVASGGRAPALAMWRRGETAFVALFRKGEVHQRLIWAPEWTTIEPVSLHRVGLQEFVAAVTYDLGLGESDGAELIKAFKLDQQDAVHLRALIRRPTASIPELLALLGLPPIVGEVFGGRAKLTDLPQARTFAPASSITSLVRHELIGKGSVPLPPDPTAQPPKRRWGRGR